jgi:hypothetical protein
MMGPSHFFFRFANGDVVRMYLDTHSTTVSLFKPGYSLRRLGIQRGWDVVR